MLFTILLGFTQQNIDAVRGEGGVQAVCAINAKVVRQEGPLPMLRYPCTKLYHTTTAP